MTINQAALDLIKRSEGFVDHWYPDPGTGAEPMTCCYGHTSAAGPPRYSPGQTFTEAEGEAILRQDLANTEATVKQLVKVPLNENQYGALVSFVFNVGGGNFATSTLLRLLNAGEYAQAASQFARWNLAAGKVLPGLVTRRAAEATLFSTPPLPTSKPIPFPPLPMPPKSIPPVPAKPIANGAWAELGRLFLEIIMAIVAIFARKPK
jgi:lysozyme